MSLSNRTKDMIYMEDSRPDDVAERWMTICAGLFMISASAFGIVLNVIVLYRFVSGMGKMTGFYLLCSSKTISNMVTLWAYFLYNGPVSLFNHYYGPDALNAYINQVVAYGIYVQGPMTQVCIAANRFLVILFPAHAKRKSGKSMTVLSLSICWVISLFTTIVGFPHNCVNIFNVEILTWDSLDECLDIVADCVMYFVFALSIVSNAMNFVIASKLIFASTKAYLDSAASKRRKKTTRKLFLQNCFQDWVYIIDTINSMYIYALSGNILFQFMFTIFSNLFVPVADGIIMLFFNYEKKTKPLMVLTPRKRDLTAIITA